MGRTAWARWRAFSSQFYVVMFGGRLLPQSTAEPEQFHFHDRSTQLSRFCDSLRCTGGILPRSVNRRGHSKPSQVNLDPKAVLVCLLIPAPLPHARIYGMTVLLFHCVLTGSGHRIVGLLWLKEIKTGQSPILEELEYAAEPGGVCLAWTLPKGQSGSISSSFCLRTEKASRDGRFLPYCLRICCFLWFYLVEGGGCQETL